MPQPEVLKQYTAGTHRATTPEETHAAISPLLPRFGISRCADITGLDRIGIPVFAAVRPRGRTLQASQGKGVRRVDAQVSALMESIEMSHAENPQSGVRRRASLRDLLGAGQSAVEAHRLLSGASIQPLPPTFIADWVRAEDLRTERTMWVPSSCVYLTWSSHPVGSNGLASGNHLVEATLHALCEVIERDSLSRLRSGFGSVDFSRCSVCDLATVKDDVVEDLIGRINRAGLVLRLVDVPAPFPVRVFMAVILDPEARGAASQVNLGYGAHISKAVAAARAITEAAQSRLTLIHGTREDLRTTAYRDSHDGTFEAFMAFEPDATWKDLPEAPSSQDLAHDLARVLDALPPAYGPVLRVDLSMPGLPVHVVRVFVVGSLATYRAI